MFNFFKKPQLLYLVYNEEEHVGSFLQDIFKTPAEAEAYIKTRREGSLLEFQQLLRDCGDEFAQYLPEQYLPEQLNLTIVVFNTQTHSFSAYSGTSR